MTTQNHVEIPPVEASKWVNEASRLGVIVLGGLYVVGLLIINIDLGRHGLISLNLARPEYIMAGLLWAFLCGGSIGAAMFLAEVVQQTTSSIKLKEKSAISGVLLVVFMVLSTIVIFDTGLRTLSLQQIGFLSDKVDFFLSIFTYAVIALNAATLYAGFKSISNLAKEMKPFSPSVWFYATYRGFTPFFAIVQFLAALSSYAVFSYPHFAKEFGGGKKPVVHMFVSDPSLLSPSIKLLPTEKSDELIGPVKLVFESETMFFVTPISRDEKRRFPWVSEPDTMGIAKGLVKAVRYSREQQKP